MVKSYLFQAVCNLWEEEGDWLNLNLRGVIPILGLAVDPLTQVPHVYKLSSTIQFKKNNILLDPHSWGTGLFNVNVLFLGIHAFSVLQGDTGLK